ncbi:MAG: hypothetical protein LBF88_03205 [Planctomycetaceae bacterium]|jgi:hypothetical protein|nr:hypothetical protein [Planctomycetaceae bacterium]
MPKILCIISFVISCIIFLVFLANMLAGVPFGSAGGILINIGMIIGSLIIGTFSVLTFLESR